MRIMREEEMQNNNNNNNAIKFKEFIKHLYTHYYINIFKNSYIYK